MDLTPLKTLSGESWLSPSARRRPSPGTSDLSVLACPEDHGGRALLPPTGGHCCARWTPQSFPLVDQKGAGTSKAHSPAPQVPAAGREGPRCPSGRAMVSSSCWANEALQHGGPCSLPPLVKTLASWPPGWSGRRGVWPGAVSGLLPPGRHGALLHRGRVSSTGDYGPCRCPATFPWCHAGSSTKSSLTSTMGT